MKRGDLRPQLEAIAKGKYAPPADASIVDEASVNAHQAAYAAWHKFAKADHGEPLHAPAAILAPLP